MDVTLVLTHRCNLDCHYCYAGRHVHKDMGDDMIERGLDLLYADGATSAQLSFFGGEPFLQRHKLQRAVLGARRRAEAAGAGLEVQCTTNGTCLEGEDLDFIAANRVRITVSIDGIREAHEMNRPRAGGRSSFDAVVANLRALVQRGQDPEVCMVITPDTVPFVYRSVSWFWDLGVRRVKANLELGATWDAVDRHELQQELATVGWELLARRVRGEQVVFHPFMRGIRSAARVLESATVGSLQRTIEPWSDATSSCSSSLASASSRAPRLQVVVGTTGHLYPCAPMVGEDDDRGPEASLRIGHMDDGLPALAAQLRAKNADCSSGHACACAAYLETGDRAQGGPMGLWFGEVCEKLGRAVGAGFFADRHRVAQGSLDNSLRPRWKWRATIAGLAAATSGVAIMASSLLRGGITSHDAGQCPTPERSYIDAPGRHVRTPLPEPFQDPPDGYMTAGVIVSPERVSTRDNFLWVLENNLALDDPSITDHGFGGPLPGAPHPAREPVSAAHDDPCGARMSLEQAPGCARSPGSDDHSE